MQAKLSLKYSGPSVDAGLMDVYQVSANMIAFSEFMVVAAKSTFGDKVIIKTEVDGFSQGSFITDLVFNFVGPVATIFATLSTSDLIDIVSESFKLWKHLRGEPPAKINHISNQIAEVANNNGHIIQVQTQTINLVFNEKSGDAVKQFIQSPLLNDGIDSVDIGFNKKIIAGVSEDEGRYFGPVIPPESFTDTSQKITLIIEAATFKNGNKWRFYDGQNSFFADIVDLDFLNSVDNGERFGKGDMLRVDLRIIQEKVGNKINTNRTITKVHEHKAGPSQGSLI
jgi:hypothetical protein